METNKVVWYLTYARLPVIIILDFIEVIWFCSVSTEFAMYMWLLVPVVFLINESYFGTHDWLNSKKGVLCTHLYCGEFKCGELTCTDYFCHRFLLIVFTMLHRYQSLWKVWCLGTECCLVEGRSEDQSAPTDPKYWGISQPDPSLRPEECCLSLHRNAVQVGVFLFWFSKKACSLV